MSLLLILHIHFGFYHTIVLRDQGASRRSTTARSQRTMERNTRQTYLEVAGQIRTVR
jgi:hypothetical protein